MFNPKILLAGGGVAGAVRRRPIGHRDHPRAHAGIEEDRLQASVNPFGDGDGDGDQPLGV